MSRKIGWVPRARGLTAVPQPRAAWVLCVDAPALHRKGSRDNDYFQQPLLRSQPLFVGFFKLECISAVCFPTYLKLASKGRKIKLYSAFSM